MNAKWSFVVAVAMLTNGCANQSAVSKTSVVEAEVRQSNRSIEIISSPEDFQNILVKAQKVCALSSPPGFVSDQGANFTMGTPAGGSDSVNAGSVTGGSQSLGEKTYLVDQVLYRLCEMGINYELSKDEMLDYFVRSLELVSEVDGLNFDATSLEKEID